MKLYSVYSSNYDVALDTLEKLSKESYFENLCPNRHALESLLINPIQRIPRYKHSPSSFAIHWSPSLYLTDALFQFFSTVPYIRYIMLLEDLWRHTPQNHPDNKGLEEALTTCVRHFSRISFLIILIVYIPMEPVVLYSIAYFRKKLPPTSTRPLQQRATRNSSHNSVLGYATVTIRCYIDLSEWTFN